MHFIRQLFEGKVENGVHLLFTRYGRGEFMGPVCVVEVKDSIKFAGSVEYCNVFGWLAASCGGDFIVDGSLYSKLDFRDTLSGVGVEFDDKSKVRQGYFVAYVEDELSSSVLVDVYEKVPYATILLNLRGDKAKLKCKKKPPKPGGEKDASFCSGVLDLSVRRKLMDKVFFDVGEFKEARVENRFIIDELVIPADVSPAEARLQAKRKGRVERTVVADGVEKKSECKFLV